MNQGVNGIPNSPLWLVELDLLPSPRVKSKLVEDEGEKYEAKGLAAERNDLFGLTKPHFLCQRSRALLSS